LLDGQAPRPVKAERIALRPGMSSAEAFQAVARSCLRQAVRNEAIVREHGAPEAIHQFRVGLRRLRAAASLFGDLLGDDESRAIRAELRWINHSLGPVRDLDVLLGRLREAADQDPSVQAAERRREEAFAELIARMDEPRFRRASLAAAGWIEAGRWLRARSAPLRAGRDQPIEERAADELSRRWKRVTKRAKRVDELEPEARHEVRIEIKKLRYGVEFFGSLFTGKRAKDRRKKVLALLEQFQEVLGELNDLAVGGNLLAPAPATGVARSAQPDEDGLLRRAKDISRGLAAAKRFWR
jgi:CHAD domain-containing protein